MKNILIIANFCRDFSKNDNGRFMYLCKELSKNNNVEIITSDFSHSKKKHKSPLIENWPFKITFLHELGYKKNISLKRFLSHYLWGKKVKKYLNNIKKPDVIYCAIPSLTAPLEAAKFCKKNNIKFIIDIQDLWPEAYRMFLDIPMISDVVFFPIKYRANRIYKTADEIIAVSRTYAKRGISVNKKCKEPVVAFLGTEKKLFDQYAIKKFNKNFLENDIIKIVYIGSLSNSYDIKCIIDALSIIKSKNVKFLIMGDGLLRNEFEKYAIEKKINCTFTGVMPYPEMVEKLVNCDIAVNPIRKGSAGSIINKIGDYAMAGLPVVNTQECAEYRELLDTYGAGINCECGNAYEVAKALQTLIEDNRLRIEMGNNSRKLGEEKIDREFSYKRIIDIVEKG